VTRSMNAVDSSLRLRLLAIALAGAGVLAQSSTAQTTYATAQTYADVFGGSSFRGAIHQRRLLLREQVKFEEEHARFHLGPVRLLPTLAFGGIGYTNNVFGTASNPLPDWTATVAAGVRYLLPLGPKLYLRGDVVPEYTWYREYVQLRNLGGLYSASLVGLFNRLTFSAKGATWSRSEPLSSEQQQPYIHRTDGGGAELEIEFLRRLSAVGGYGVARTTYTEITGATSSVTSLDRTETAGFAGLRYRFHEYFSVAGLVEKKQADFVNDSTGRNNETTGYLLAVRYDQKRFYLSLLGGYVQARPTGCSTFPDYNELAGSAYLSYFVSRRVELQGWVDRAPVNSLYADNPYFIETRVGGSVNVGVGQRTTLRGFVSAGSNRYPLPVEIQGGEVVTRQDDIVTWGGGFDFGLNRSLQLTVLAAETKNTSNVPGSGYSTFRFTTGLSFRPTPTENR